MSNVSVDPIMGLSLSDNVSLEYVLSDIPFFCVGLTALAVFAFFMVMRRIDLPAIYLYSSSLLAFVAAILDLTQVLLRGATNTDRGLDLADVTGIIDTREVILALAFGFRYLYLWAFVAQRPRYEPRPRTQVDPLFSETYLHSASWERWGAPGFVLKYALLGAVISIPILQIIWRIVTGFSAVYIAESTIQIAVSVLLIAKLMLNLFLSTVAPWWRPFTPYILPIMGLMISTGIGAGNLLLFKFSETTLGRFLQAVESYSLILSLLIFTFYKVPRYIPPNAVSAARKRSSFFTGIPEKMEESPFQVSPPIVETPVIELGRRAPSSRESTLSQISSWINVRKPPRAKSGEQKLWNSGDAELGISTEVRETTEVQATTPESSADTPMSPPVQVLEEKQRPFISENTNEPQYVIPPTPNALEVTTPSSMGRPFTGISFASYYGMATSSRLTMPNVAPGDEVRSTDSPVYGLNGIVTPGPAEPESPTLARPSSLAPPAPSAERESVNSFDELLRQQTELDKSIAALRLFSRSPTTTSFPLPPEPDSNTKSMSISSGKSVSARSEFSLSIFPDPPPVDRTSVVPIPVPSGRARDPPFPSRRARRQSTVPHSAVSMAGPELDAPDSPTRVRFDSSVSAGTQYDVTSFIGDLTIPGPSSSEPRMGVLGEVAEKSETESDFDSPMITGASTVTLRPLLLSSAVPSITSLPPATASSGVLTSTTQPTNYEYPVLKPLLLGSAPAVPSPLSSGARRTPGPSVFAGPRRPARSNQRPVISVPRQLEDEQPEGAEAFEKPRRPPALTNLSNGYE